MNDKEATQPEQSPEIVGARSKPKEKTYPLETAEGGWVRIKRLDHGHATERMDEILTFKSGTQPGTSVRVLSNWKARLYDFANCIVDHNLGDAETGMKFDFSKEKDVRELDEDIGDEIQGLINKHHGRVEIEETDEDDIPEKDPN